MACVSGSTMDETWATNFFLWIEILSLAMKFSIAVVREENPQTKLR